MTEDTQRKGLWERIWVRLPAYLICTPVIIMISDAAVSALYFWVTGGDIAVIPSNMLLIVTLTVMQLVPLIVPLILVELGNRRRGWPIPAHLCALFVGVFAVVMAGMTYGSAQVIRLIPGSDSFTSGAPFTVLFLLSCCVTALVISWVLMSPFLRRWLQRNASGDNLAGHF